MWVMQNQTSANRNVIIPTSVNECGLFFQTYPPMDLQSPNKSDTSDLENTPRRLAARRIVLLVVLISSLHLA